MQLNPVIFSSSDNSAVMKSDIRAKLLEIANAFLNYLQDDGLSISVADIRLVGSNAGFDYTAQSDIDLHIVTDFDALACNPDIIQAAFNSERHRFNSTFDITIKELDVELYVEDVKAGTESQGIYSVLYDKWVKYPVISGDEFSEEFMAEAEPKVIEWTNIIDKALLRNELNDIQRTLNRIYMMRKNGLETSGRYSAGNFIFKQLRNRGYIKKLIDTRNELTSKTLSLESKSFIENVLRRT